MDISTNTHNVDIVVVELKGQLDAFESTDVRALLTGEIEAGRCRIVIDLSAIEFVDSAGLAALVQAMKRARENGGDVRIVQPIDPVAYRVFELTKFDQVFTIGSSSEELVSGW